MPFEATQNLCYVLAETGIEVGRCTSTASRACLLVILAVFLRYVMLRHVLLRLDTLGWIPLTPL